MFFKSTVLLNIVLLISIFAYEEADIDKMFDDLNRQKFNTIETKYLDNPFKTIELNLTQDGINNKNVDIVDINSTIKAIPKLIAIVNNRAKIDDKWLSVEDNISEFTILNINYNSVILGNEDGNETLSLLPQTQVVRKSNEVK